MAEYKSRVNGLGLSTSQKQGASPAGQFVTNLGNLGATVRPLVASNDPGPEAGPSAQGTNHPGTRQAPQKPYQDKGPFNSPRQVNTNNG